MSEPRLVTRAEAAEVLGYSPRSLASLMNRYPDQWPKPVTHRPNADGRGRVLLYDLEELLAAHGPQRHERGEGRAISRNSATVSDDDGLIVCLYCDRRFRSLGRHLQAAHGVTAAEYRAEHKLPATSALAADVVRLQMQERQIELLEADPAALDHLKPYNSPEYLAELGRRSIEPNHATRDYEIVREHRLPAQRHAVRRMNAAYRRRMDAAAQAAGYADMAEAIRSTVDLPAKVAARRLGIGATTVGRWRERLASDNG